MRGKGRKQVIAQKSQGQPLWTPSLWWVSPAGWAGTRGLWALSPVWDQCRPRGCCPVTGWCPSPGGGPPRQHCRSRGAKLSGQPWQKSPRLGDGDAAPSAAHGHPVATLISPANSWPWSVPSAHSAQARGPDKPSASSPQGRAPPVSFPSSVRGGKRCTSALTPGCTWLLHPAFRAISTHAHMYTPARTLSDTHTMLLCARRTPTLPCHLRVVAPKSVVK